MLARNGPANLIVFAIIIIAVVVGRIAEYLRKQKAEKELKERKLRQGGGASEPGARPRLEAAKQPAAGGLQSLLEALEGRAKGPGTDASVREEAEPRMVPGMAPAMARVMDPATVEHERARAEEARKREASSFEEYLYEHPSEPEPAPESPSETPAEAEPAPVAPRAALAAAGLFAGGGRAPIREEARRGVLWSVVLGPPRGTVPYGERGAAEAPGGIR